MLPRPHLTTRGLYGGLPPEVLEGSTTLEELGINAVFLSSPTRELVEMVHRQGSRIFAEFNTLHDYGYVAHHPDAAPVGPDGLPAPPADAWQGVCPTHPGYRQERMNAFRALLQLPLEGVWLDYHHSHADWERADPILPDTCFCARCRDMFAQETGLALQGGAAEQAHQLLGEYREQWVNWRCALFTGWVRDFRGILEQMRPTALLGTFHCPWSETDYAGAMRHKLNIDLRAQQKYIDVFSIMPYHARFGHAADTAWISRQIQALAGLLELSGGSRDSRLIWPIVQLCDWGEEVTPADVTEVLDQATRQPATGVIAFAWGRLKEQPANVSAMAAYYRYLAGTAPHPA